MSKAKITIDEGADKNVATHTFTEGGEERNIERVSISVGPLALPSSPQVSEETATGDYPTTAIDVVGNGSIVVQPQFSDSSGTAKAKFLFYDSNNVLISVSDEKTFTAGTDQNSASKYIGTTVFIDNKAIGASSLKVRITEVPSSGNVSFAVATI